MENTTNAVPKVYQAIASVMATLSKEGISKGRKNQQQGYQFRGIDDVFNALSPILSDNKLCVLPRVLSRSVTERQTARGGAIFYTVLDVEFDFVSAEDGSKHTVRTMGEAMDSGDKSTNKAMSAAYKYACLQVFCIPTEGENDADYITHEVAPSNNQNVRQNNQQAPQQNPEQRQQAPQPKPEVTEKIDADYAALMRTFKGAAQLGTKAFNKVWSENAGPVRARIHQNAESMRILENLCRQADQKLNQQGAA